MCAGMAEENVWTAIQDRIMVGQASNDGRPTPLCKQWYNDYNSCNRHCTFRTSTMHCHALSYTAIHVIYWHTLAYIVIHWHTLSYTDMHCHTLTYIVIHWHTLIDCHTLAYIGIHSYTGIHWHTLSYTDIHCHTLTCTVIHWHTLSYTGIQELELCGYARIYMHWTVFILITWICWYYFWCSLFFPYNGRIW